MTRNDRIQHLEALIVSADSKVTQKNQKYEAQLQAYKDRLAEGQLVLPVSPPSQGYHADLGIVQGKQQPLYNQGRIAKPLRGGGGRDNLPDGSQVAPMYQAVAAGSPLGRVQQVQQEESAGGKRRELLSRCPDCATPQSSWISVSW